MKRIKVNKSVQKRRWGESPSDVSDGAVVVDLEGHVHLCEGRLELAVLDEVDVRSPDFLVVGDGVQVLVPAPVFVLQPGVLPALVEQELHLVLLRKR
ncbi:hypothetical protein AVEN_5415-1 [Araneus ventricosus]|uniref:Uncharacterized protein n=1 Tax=Araneus ventricosus TaxID=182803 RepID=A0A4Y2MD84_ARAVE|nr:hypothetical protein AVEN_190753-1 [Araneus ventricosus]GBN23657.1 hypothetical protein AVEN_58795-1 [Araneus ventricosus]GBN34510.1 hypothetical protein AVEN_5415-1 [Araneus ventricosus]